MSRAAKDDDGCKSYHDDNAPANLQLRVFALLFAFVIYKHYRFLCPALELNVQFLHLNA